MQVTGTGTDATVLGYYATNLGAVNSTFPDRYDLSSTAWNAFSGSGTIHDASITAVHYQAYVEALSNPEPSTTLLLFGLLSGLGFIKRKKINLFSI
ncbi:MAG: PEP-CTERM sorting domain-containing protein [Chlamydiota bacterium]|nr:PEP-CTERM sorting domain-containing protein [Chlamydiota bacterium]